MSCVEVNVKPIQQSIKGHCTVTRLGEGIKANINKLGQELKASIKNIGESIFINVSELSERIHATVLNTSSGLKVKCSIICALEDVGHYLEVTPADVQWITDDMGIFYDVESNVEWIIVTS